MKQADHTVTNGARSWVRAIVGSLIGLIFVVSAGHAWAGKIVLANDEWTLANTGFAQPGSDSGPFALNVANFFTGGGTGNFLVLSSNFGLTESSLSTTMLGAGHSWTINAGLVVNAANLAPYQGVFLAGAAASGAANSAALTSYVNGGGNVYLAGGTGNFGTGAAEAAAWNPFLNNFGLAFASAFNGVGGVMPIASTHPVFSGVSGLYQLSGNDTVDLVALNPNQSVVVTGPNGQGLYAIYDPIRVPEPATLALFGLGLVGLGLAARRRKSA